MAEAAQDIRQWFEGFDEAFDGSLPQDHVLIRTYGGAGWRVKTMGVKLIVLTDKEFPYSRPQAFLEDFDRSKPQPHIEPLPQLGDFGRICLRTPIAPSNPLGAVRAAFTEARQLLKANDEGEEDHDFQEDFEAYWLHYADRGGREAALLDFGDPAGSTGAYVFWNGTHYCFPDKIRLRKWWQNLYGQWVKSPRQCVVVQLRRLPRPEQYPGTSEQLGLFLRRFAAGGADGVAELLRSSPKHLLVIFQGKSPTGNQFSVALELARRSDDKGKLLKRPKSPSNWSNDDLIGLYAIRRLRTKKLDAAKSRLDSQATMPLRSKRVVIIGCGALGSGIATMLVKAGVSKLALVDPDRLGWENIRRHELGAPAVGTFKAAALKWNLERSVPDILEVTAHNASIQDAMERHPSLMNSADLVIAATGDWGADTFVDRLAHEPDCYAAVLYTWSEAFALATHAVLIPSEGGTIASGFDEAGTFLWKASTASKKVPAECGNLTSPFGAVEVAQAQAMAARLALDFLKGKSDGVLWRTWTADQGTLDEAEGAWTPEWIGRHGEPPVHGGINQCTWPL